MQVLLIFTFLYKTYSFSVSSIFWPDDGKFPEAVRVLLTWLERGEVNRRNANNFYSMIQSSNGHIRRLTSEKSQHEKEMEEAKDKFKTALAGIVAQCESCILTLLFRLGCIIQLILWILHTCSMSFCQRHIKEYPHLERLTRTVLKENIFIIILVMW